MNARNITRRILNIVVGLHRSAIVREVAKADHRVAVAKGNVEDQQKVVRYEQDRLADAQTALVEAKHGALNVKMDAEDELDNLPQSWPF